ncbi:hypothetical protein ACTXT7_008615 [Hymenolepis weldensis]
MPSHPSIVSNGQHVKQLSNSRITRNQGKHLIAQYGEKRASGCSVEVEDKVGASKESYMFNINSMCTIRSKEGNRNRVTAMFNTAIKGRNRKEVEYKADRSKNSSEFLVEKDLEPREVKEVNFGQKFFLKAEFALDTVSMNVGSH